MVLDAVDFLVVLVAFACDEDDVAWLCVGDGVSNGFTAVWDGKAVCAFGDAWQDVLNDGVGGFCALVVAGDDDKVRQLRCGGSHLGAFGAVAVAAAAKQGDEAIVRQLLQAAEGVAQRVVRVGLIDIDGKAVFWHGNGLHAARGAL